MELGRSPILAATVSGLVLAGVLSGCGSESVQTCTVSHDQAALWQSNQQGYDPQELATIAEALHSDTDEVMGGMHGPAYCVEGLSAADLHHNTAVYAQRIGQEVSARCLVVGIITRSNVVVPGTVYMGATIACLASE